MANRRYDVTVTFTLTGVEAESETKAKMLCDAAFGLHVKVRHPTTGADVFSEQEVAPAASEEDDVQEASLG
jgi:hypothetical protein